MLMQLTVFGKKSKFKIKKIMSESKPEGKEILLQSPVSEVLESAAETSEQMLRKMREYQFKYADGLMRKNIDFLNGEKVEIKGFEDIVRNWTRIPLEIRDAYCKRTGKNQHELQEDAEYKDIFDKIVAEICGQYELNSDFETLSSKSFEIVSDVINTLPQSEKQVEEHKVGVLSYNIEKSDKDGKDYVDIHFRSLFMQQQTEPGKEHLTREELPEEIKKSCEQLAEIIKKNHPNVAGVMCTSWLVDTDWFADAVGFDRRESTLANETGFTKGNGFWGQFISKTGEFKEDKAKSLLSGQKPKHLAMFNIISSEEFLAMHARK
jgi:hypothetical protein